MALQLAIMIEGQEGLTWERWRRLAQTVEGANITRVTGEEYGAKARVVPEDAAGWRAAGFLHGVVAQVREDLARWEAAGVGRVMLQMLDMDDLDAIRLIGQECL